MPGERNRISVKGVHVDGRGRISPVALYRWLIAPHGGGADGEGDGRSPAPVAACHRDTVLTSGNTPTTRPLRGLLPPPREGAGKCLAIGTMAVSGEWNRISVKGVHVDGRGRISPVAAYRWRIATLGVWVETPPHLSPECCLCKNILGVERGLWRWRFTGLIFDGRPLGRRRVAQILYIPSLITSRYETYKR